MNTAKNISWNRLQTLIFILFCQFLGIAAHLQAGELPVLRVGYMNSLSQLPIITSYERDRFSLRTVRVQLENYRTAVALEAAFRVGGVDVAYLPLSAALAIRQDREKVRWGESLHHGRGGLLVRKEVWRQRGVQSLGVIGVLNLRGAGHLGFAYLLQREGLDYGLDGKVRVVREEEAEGLLENGEISGCGLPEPYRTRLLLHHGEELVEMDYPEVPFVLVFQPRVLEEDFTRPLEEWLESVRASCLFLAEDIGLYGGEQSILTQSRYFGYDTDLLRLVFLKNPRALTFTSWRVGEKLVREVEQRMVRLEFLHSGGVSNPHEKTVTNQELAGGEERQ